MTIAQRSESRFLPALARLENCLETPIVPGELAAWFEAVRESWDEVGQLLREEVAETHDHLLRQIARQDLALAPRVEELKSRENALRQHWHELEVELDRLVRQAGQVEPQEAKLQEYVECFTHSAIELVVDARTLDTAVATWHIEAFDRDRGIAD